VAFWKGVDLAKRDQRAARSAKIDLIRGLAQARGGDFHTDGQYWVLLPKKRRHQDGRGP